jgi:7,8-dihydropterin-6-yl-methyl-4-(beta-D-ribofuranosyl)aminobenzene 5'-phosphate synthase
MNITMKEELIITFLILSMFVGIPILIVSVEGEERQELPTNPANQRPDDVTMTVMYDNYPSQEGLETGWGFSCLIQGTEKTILFDTGGNGTLLLANMKKLGVHPEDIDLVVLSHIHGDHVGGVFGFLEQDSAIPVYLPISFPTSFKADVKKSGADIVEIQGSLKICDDVYSSGELPGQIEEQALIVRTDNGLIIITGCAHSGIVSIVRRAKELLNDDVLLVMGGFHLGDKHQDALERIVADFKTLGVKYVGPCHCSGDTTSEVFKKQYQNNFLSVAVGTVITVADLPYRKIGTLVRDEPHPGRA